MKSEHKLLISIYILAIRSGLQEYKLEHFNTIPYVTHFLKFQTYDLTCFSGAKMDHSELEYGIQFDSFVNLYDKHGTQLAASH